MNIILIVLICGVSDLIYSVLTQTVNFEWNQDQSTPRPTPVISSKEVHDVNGRDDETKPECACVVRARCAVPGVIGPREMPNDPFTTIEVNDSKSSNNENSVSRIINEPSPGVLCPPETVFCCNIIAEVKPEKRFTCGIRKIIKFPQITPTFGQVEFGKYPWMTLILTSENGFIAGGSLLDEFTVLTSAHNVQDYLGDRCKSLKVRIGEWNTAILDEPFPFVEVKVHHIITHPAFDSLSLENDIAVIKLDPSCQLAKIENPNINSICLPPSDAHFNGERCWVAGYGKTESGKASSILREVDLRVMNGNFCQNLLRKTILGQYFMLQQSSFICAGGEAGKDACTQDGGSALVCERPEGHWQIAGIVSWGIGCGDSNIPGVYVNVSTYVDWIKNTS